jgi:hypothetical protein
LNSKGTSHLKKNIKQEHHLVKDQNKIRSAYDRQIEDLNETLQRLAREKAANINQKKQNKRDVPDD